MNSQYYNISFFVSTPVEAFDYLDKLLSFLNTKEIYYFNQDDFNFETGSWQNEAEVFTEFSKLYPDLKFEITVDYDCVDFSKSLFFGYNGNVINIAQKNLEFDWDLYNNEDPLISKIYKEIIFNGANTATKNITELVEDSYIVIDWPEVQEFMDTEWFREEAILNNGTDAPSSQYLIPLKRIV